ncbi:hypothetical protein BOX15_Mlig015757g1 [Macrostomum lignano]|uniref:Uncharacterized protein n=1 Tax=Macrostomum lignano TaxID=282301 RepID=A0A267ENL9_9PLAT|nr:hypothetical protein BOX15_Mlig015757g1 [Macrostomum lignano]
MPPYSPLLNAAKFANSLLKAAIKSRLTQPDVVGEEAGAPGGISQEEWRSMLLERVARESLGVAVTAEEVAWRCSHSEHCILRCPASWFQHAF